MEVAKDFAANKSGRNSVKFDLVAARTSFGAVASVRTLSTRFSTGFTGIGTTRTTNV